VTSTRRVLRSEIDLVHFALENLRMAHPMMRTDSFFLERHLVGRGPSAAVVWTVQHLV